MAKQKKKPLCGADYIAAVELTHKAGGVIVEVGGTCEDIPTSSLGWLIECGAIKPKPRPKAKPKPKAKAKTTKKE